MMDVGVLSADALRCLRDLSSQIDLQWLLENKLARAIGMLAIVWVTIWVIALVYSGYARDSEIGPVGLRPHTNRRLGHNIIVFDQSLFKFQMHGVEARCQFFFVYEDRFGNARKISLGAPETLQLHIRGSEFQRDDKVCFGFEGPDYVKARYVYLPAFDDAPEPERIDPSPETVGEFVKARDLVSRWTEDDEAPIISVSQARLDLLTSARADYIAERARALEIATNGNVIQQMLAKQLAKDAPNIFGTYSVKLTFSKDPIFVLFKHPNPDLKMTGWLTLLTSIFALAMDAWPVDYAARAVGDHPKPRVEATRDHSTHATKPISNN